MITYREAVNIIRREAAGIRLATEKVDLSLIKGRVCADKVISPLNVPSFDNSAMDGFALQYGDAVKKLKIKARVTAGDTIHGLKISAGECCEIMTGAPLPQGTETIIPVEQAKREGDMVSFSVMPRPGDHIRKTGSDFMSGAQIIKQGTLLETPHILPLAALGIGKLNVYSKPKVAFIPTGREVTDRLDQTLEEGKIYNSSLPYALAFLAEAGAEVLPQETIPDNPEQFQAAVERLMKKDVRLIISSGAVSAGSHDFIRGSLEKMGAVILFHKVAIKPGKPILFAKLPNGALYLGLPGNPIATSVGIRFFVQPLLSALTHQPPELPVFARAKTSLSRKPGLRLFLKAKIGVSPEGVLEAELLDGQESYKTGPFLSMNGWAVIPEDRQVIDINDITEVFPLRLFS